MCPFFCCCLNGIGHLKLIKHSFSDSFLHYHNNKIKSKSIAPCLSWLGILQQNESLLVRLLVRFLVRAHAWVLGLVPGCGTCKRQPTDASLTRRCFSLTLMFLSLSFSLLSPYLKVNKIFKK